MASEGVARRHIVDVSGLLSTLEKIVRRPSVTDVLISAESGVWVDDVVHGLVSEMSGPCDEQLVRELAVHLINQGGRHIDHMHPCVDARLPSGLRVHAVLGGVSVSGTTISIRVPQVVSLSLSDLVERNTLTADYAEVLAGAVNERKNVLICGGGGTGKTTLLTALLSGVPDNERIVVVEDVSEIRLTQPQLVSLESRPPNVEGLGAIDTAELVRQSLRMRADRLVVGEIRGTEIVPFLSALNTGHSGGGSTLHVNSLSRIPSRIEALGLLAGVSRAAICAMAMDAIDLVVQLSRVGPQRTVTGIGRFRLNTSGGLSVGDL